MDPQPVDDIRQGSPAELGDGIGGRLRAARTERGLDLERIAAQLHLRPALIEALEEGRYDALPGPVFVAGYIRNYGRQVGLDPEALITEYLSAHRKAEPARVWARPLAARSDQGSSGFLIRLVTVLLVAGVAYLFVQWWQGRVPTVAEPPAEPTATEDSPGPTRATDRAVAQEPEPTKREPVGAPRPAERPTESAPTLSGQPAAHRPSPDTVAETPVAPAPSTTEAGQEEPPEASPAPTLDAAQGPAQDSGDAAAVDAGTVVLEFRGPCWVDVRDSTKSFSLTGEMSTGDRRVLGGTPPYSLILGNAAAVRVTVKGAPFDLNPVTKGNVARFKLDPAALP